jgi:outer membrane protein TolC
MRLNEINLSVDAHGSLDCAGIGSDSKQDLKMKDTFLAKLVTLLLALSITACTSIPDDGGLSEVNALIDDKLSDDVELPGLDSEDQFSGEQVSQMIAAPLTLGDAEKLSVGHNPMMKVKLIQVGIAEADYAQAGRMENPGFSYERLSGGDETTTSLLFDIGGVILMPLRRQLEARNLEVARYQTAADVLDHIASARKAWITAVAEKQQTALVTRALESAETGNNLTRQMSALGHSNVIEAADSEIFLSEMRASLSKQRLAEAGAKESLIRQLGLWGRQARALEMPDRLPALPVEPASIASIEREAIENRLDVRMANMNIEAMAKNLSLTRLSPFFSAIELGPVVEKSGRETERGFELEFRIPIFDAGGITTQKAAFIYQKAVAQAEVTAISAASSARQALDNYRSNLEIARHYRDVVLPLRERISKEQLLMYNGMLISVFDLLDDLRSAMQLEAAYIDAVRDFWLADANLQLALTGAGMPDMSFEGSATMPSSGGGEAH